LGYFEDQPFIPAFSQSLVKTLIKFFTIRNQILSLGFLRAPHVQDCEASLGPLFERPGGNLASYWDLISVSSLRNPNLRSVVPVDTQCSTHCPPPWREGRFPGVINQQCPNAGPGLGMGGKALVVSQE
jgi:hypothetical protein